MSNEMRKTFELAVPVERAWQAFTDAEQLSQWAASGGYKEFDAREGGRYVLSVEGMPDMEGRVLEAEPNRRLVYTEPPGILPGETVVTVTFEAAETGTKVTIVQSGFGDGEDWLGQLESYETGWREGIQDLYLFLRSGLRGNRFFTWQSSFGTTVRDVPAGAEVLRVSPGSFAEQAGMRPGDLFLKVGNASIFAERDISLLTREHPPGTTLEVTYVRDREILSGKGTLTAMF